MSENEIHVMSQILGFICEIKRNFEYLDKKT
jgi:hypothetical protein